MDAQLEKLNLFGGDDSKPNSTIKRSIPINEMTFEEKKAKVAKFNLTSDTFFCIIMNGIQECQEFIDVILGDGFKVISVTVQKSVRNLDKHSIIMDVLALTSEGKRVNIEMQMADDDDHVKRVRYYQACSDANELPKGSKYNEISDYYSIYITNNDFIGLGDARYDVNRMIVGKYTGKVESLPNGTYEVYINLENKEKTDGMFKDLLDFIVNSDPNKYRNEFNSLSNKVRFYKENQEGVDYMCSILKEERAEGRAEGRAEERENGIVNSFKIAYKYSSSVERSISDISLQYNISTDKVIEILKKHGVL